MSTVAIHSVKLIKNGSLEVYPCQLFHSTFEQVYRAAKGVYWAPQSACFYMKKFDDWDGKKIYDNILSAVRGELGIELLVDNETRWLGLSKITNDTL